MASTKRVPLRVREMRPHEIAEALRRDPRLLLPVGTCEEHGPHLPLGCDTIIMDALVDDLSAELQILRAPTFEYGVNYPTEHMTPGAAGVRRKSLLRALNDLIDAWESGGVKQFILLTANGFDQHIESLSTVITKRASVQVVDILGIPVPEATHSPLGALHADEIDTSILLHLRPELVEMSRAADYFLARGRGNLNRANLRITRQSTGSFGVPTQASAVKGAAIYKRIKRLVLEKVLLAPPDEELA